MGGPGIRVVDNEADFDAALAAAGDRLVVAKFTASWCGPCKQIAPVYADLAARPPSARPAWLAGAGDASAGADPGASAPVVASPFLEVDVDAADALAARERVRAMPTFVAYLGGARVGEAAGADPRALTALVEGGARLAARRRCWPAPGAALAVVGLATRPELNGRRARVAGAAAGAADAALPAGPADGRAEVRVEGEPRPLALRRDRVTAAVGGGAGGAGAGAGAGATWRADGTTPLPEGAREGEPAPLSGWDAAAGAYTLDGSDARAPPSCVLLPAGSAVCLTGLTARADANGAAGRVVGFRPEDDRYDVAVPPHAGAPSGERLRVRRGCARL